MSYTVKVSGLKLSDSKTRALSLQERIAWLWSCTPVNLFGGMEWGRASCWDWGCAETWSVGATVCAVSFSPLVPPGFSVPHSPQPSRLVATLVCCSKHGVRHS